MAIRVTPEELRAMAKKLKGYAQQASKMATDIKNAINTGTAAWEGNSKDKYEQSFREIELTLTKSLPELLTSMASSAEATAKRFEDADR